jgi:methylmalonyl-CoA mutase
MSDKRLTFADDFPAADAADWARMAEQALKGRALDEALVSHSDEGLAIRALSVAADGVECVAGIGRSGPWDIRQAALHPEPEVANVEILADLAGGATSLALYLNHGSAGGDVAAEGVMAPTLATLDVALKDVLLGVAGVSLVAGPASFAAAAALAALWAQREVADDQARAWLNLDPLGNLAASGTIACGLDAAYDRMADVARTSAARWPNVRSVAVTTHACHGAGCGEAQELALALATGVAYLRALEARGLDPEAAAGEMLFRVTVDADIFLTIAKLRSLRSLWARVLGACGVSEAGEMQIEALAAPRMYAAMDAPVNILRATAACMAAAVGGADAITVLPHTLSLGLADRPARRIARNLQVILEEESGLARVADPASGAFAIEALTGDLSVTAWTLFQQIEEQGGMAAALVSGSIQSEVARVSAARLGAIAVKDKLLTGVNSFADPEAPVAPVLTPDLSGLQASAATQDLSRLSFAEAVEAMGEGACLADLAPQGERMSVAPLIPVSLSAGFTEGDAP